MTSTFFGEFMGTMILILLGNGVVAGALLKHSKGVGSGWIVITAGWGFGVMSGIFTAIACGSADAHLNPAVTLGFAIVKGDFSKLGPYILAQLLGAMAGAVLVWLHYLPHWKATENPDLTLACFSTSPAISRFGANLLSEIIGTFVLILVVAAITSKAVGSSGPAGALASGYTPYLVGMLIWAIGLSLGGTTGYAINPARDLGPRIVYTLLPINKQGGSNWRYALVPVAGPMLGAILAGIFVRWAGI
jgi:glycerol uptake facilitator protein